MQERLCGAGCPLLEVNPEGVCDNLGYDLGGRTLVDQVVDERRDVRVGVHRFLLVG